MCILQNKKNKKSISFIQLVLFKFKDKTLLEDPLLADIKKLFFMTRASMTLFYLANYARDNLSMLIIFYANIMN